MSSAQKEAIERAISTGLVTTAAAACPLDVRKLTDLALSLTDCDRFASPAEGNLKASKIAMNGQAVFTSGNAVGQVKPGWGHANGLTGLPTNRKAMGHIAPDVIGLGTNPMGQFANGVAEANGIPNGPVNPGQENHEWPANGHPVWLPLIDHARGEKSCNEAVKGSAEAACTPGKNACIGNSGQAGLAFGKAANGISALNGATASRNGLGVASSTLRVIVAAASAPTFNIA